MEVGHQPIYEAEAIAGRDEEIGSAKERRKLASRVRGAFEEPKRRGTDRNDRSSPRLHSIQCIGNVSRDSTGLRMHNMAAGIGAADGEEGARADMERHEVQ